MSSLLHTFLAQAGGGSGGFSGGGGGGFGGGGGGGFSGGGSSGSGSGGVGGVVFTILIFIGIVVVLGGGAFSAFVARRRRGQRARRVELASAEASADEPYLAADEVRREAAKLYLATQEAWDDRDRDRLAGLVGEDLMVEWRRRLDDFDARGWYNRVHVLGEPEVDYVGLVNREGEADDRVTVFVRARMEAYVETEGGRQMMRTGATSKTVTINEYWTLARRDGYWICVSIEQTGEGDHNLTDPIVAMPEADDERIHGEAVTELAVADAVPDGFTTADLAVVDFEGTARDEALDLSVQDGRFAPDVLEVAARRAVGAWVEAVDGSDVALQKLASPQVVEHLLYGDDASGRTRLVLRGGAVRRIAIAGVDAASAPAAMTVEVELAAVRYVENRDTTTVVSGSKNRASTFAERWTFALEGPPDSPWLLTQAA